MWPLGFGSTTKTQIMPEPHPLVKQLIRARENAEVRVSVVERKMKRAGFIGRWREYERGRSKLPNILLLNRVGEMFGMRLVWTSRGRGRHKQTMLACAEAVCLLCREGRGQLVEVGDPIFKRWVHRWYGADLRCRADGIWRLKNEI